MIDSGASAHMLSKKVLSPDEMETLWRSRTLTVVVTANGEVQTKEEAQIYVHDIGLFVTVQLVEDTLAVLSLGKLCEEHGYSYEWVNGQQPRFTKKREDCLYKTDKTSYLLSFQEYPPVQVHRHFTTRHQQVQTRSEVTNTHQETAAQKIKKK